MKKSINYLILALFAIVSSSFLVGCGPPKVDLYEEIQPSETVYVIPLEGETSKQGKFDSEEYLERNKVATKRVYLPLRKVSTGRYTWNYKWVPTVKVVKVDRKPITFVWEDKSGINVESKDSIGFTVGVNLSAYITEENTSRFLYRYPSGELHGVLNAIVKSKATEILSREFTKYDLEGDGDGRGARQLKGEIVELAKKELTDFFAETGVTITTFGLIGGLAYDDVEIQTAINENFKSELDIKDKENERIAQEKVNSKNVSIAKAEKDAAKAFAEAAEDRKKMVEIEVSKINAEANLVKAQKWNGSLPANIMPEGAGFILGMK